MILGDTYMTPSTAPRFISNEEINTKQGEYFQIVPGKKFNHFIYSLLEVSGQGNHILYEQIIIL